jgi:hypothetical protein
MSDQSMKQAYCRQLQTDAATLAGIRKILDDRKGVYYDRGYNSGGSNPIIDADVSDLDLTAAQVGSWITLLEQLEKFFTNQSVTTADYDATLSAIRRDI